MDFFGHHFVGVFDYLFDFFGHQALHKRLEPHAFAVKTQSTPERMKLTF